MKLHAHRTLAAGFVLACSGTALAQPAIVGFTATRGGSWSFVAGVDVSTLRAQVLSAFPSATLRGVSSLESLSNELDDVLIITSAAGATAAIAPLTSAEQTALFQFVSAGGAAVLLTDNDTFANALSDAANESIVNAFGLDTIGTGPPWSQQATVIQPAANPITNGPYGLISSYSIGWTGWYANLGPSAQPLATAANGQTVLAYIPCGALSPTSGPVILLADSTPISNSFLNATTTALVRNIIAFATTPCPPSCDTIDFNNDDVFPDDADVIDFIAVLGGASCPTCNDVDFNNDGVFPDDGDVEAFLRVLGGGAC